MKSQRCGHETDKIQISVIGMQQMNPKVRAGGCNNMTSKQILIVEDERPIREMIAFGLKRAGFDVREAEDCRAARAALADRRPDLMLIDWMLPDTSGLELTRSLKRERDTRDLPVIMLTARAEEGDKVAGLDGGADDYVTKPFSPRELVARVNAVLRRSGGHDETERVQFDELSLDRAGHRVMVGERTVPLGPTEYRLLEFFMTHPERVYSREQLLDRVWGGNVYVEERTIDVHVRRLRKALEDFGYDRLVQTVRGAGLSVFGASRGLTAPQPRTGAHELLRLAAAMRPPGGSASARRRGGVAVRHGRHRAGRRSRHLRHPADWPCWHGCCTGCVATSRSWRRRSRGPGATWWP